jgi:phosphatidylglycerophosphate synthase
MNIERSWLYRNCANIITLTRVPISLAIIFVRKDLQITLSLVLLVILTDFIDGKVAEKMGIKSKIGGELDCITDKVFFVVMFFVLIDLLFPLWLVALIIATALVELGLLYYWVLGVANGLDASTTKIPGRRYGPGQYKMFVICIAIAMCLAKANYSIKINWIDYVLWSISFVCAVWSLLARREKYIANSVAQNVQQKT